VSLGKLLCSGGSLRLSSPDVRSGYRGRARGELGGCGASDGRPNVGDDELVSESTGDGLRAGMVLSGTVLCIALVV
jgi:hypothetical protein